MGGHLEVVEGVVDIVLLQVELGKLQTRRVEGGVPEALGTEWGPVLELATP